MTVTQRYTHYGADRAASAVALLEAEKPPVCYTGVTQEIDAEMGVRVTHDESLN